MEGRCISLSALMVCTLLTGFCRSAQADCEVEQERLRAQVKALELRIKQQQLQIQRILSERENLDIVHGSDVEESINMVEGRQLFADCAEIYNSGNKRNGFYRIQPLAAPTSFSVYCDMTEGGGWTVIQRRNDGSVNFDRVWAEYKQGFGNFQSATGEYWLGNDNLHYLTSQGEYTVKFNLIDWDAEKRDAQYRNFRVQNEQNSYQLSFGTYSGTAGDSLSGTYHPEVAWWANHNGMKFSTKDRDNDRYEGNCAQEDNGGWWFNRCHSANLNGLHYNGGAFSSRTDNGIIWYTWHGWWYSLKSTVIKIRPSEFVPSSN
ncbi:fibrinogen-like protein 1 [Callorhinchus milii]|uniref:Fibrinogen-like protein 1 n=1 Tax=Callorhinchus milii TaxID=7868 RepID=V9KKJ4_CALMI|nr:fibrinogen-like protein 1 [Callorhinchus milii]XP_007890997.1 fibrinogen-like protein 1 [Callorhinchus milii]|eukprot:gi/632950913/ref/XP_007890996.1/ PREDICTED: fibrinogen-like protein 1 [Callorhinchus milii]